MESSLLGVEVTWAEKHHGDPVLLKGVVAGVFIETVYHLSETSQFPAFIVMLPDSGKLVTVPVERTCVETKHYASLRRL